MHADISSREKGPRVTADYDRILFTNNSAFVADIVELLFLHFSISICESMARTHEREFIQSV